MARSSFIVDTVLAKCGGISKVAAHFGITRSAVQQWKKNGIPANRVRTLAHLADHHVRPSDIRPDIFGQYD